MATLQVVADHAPSIGEIYANHPYIHFHGNCAEALAAYSIIFGGTKLSMLLYADGPDEPPNWKDRPRIMHGQLTLGDGTLLASDFPPGTIGDPQKGFSIMQTAPDVGRGQAWFDALATGGTVITPYGPTFFWPGFGMVPDRFGTNWIISTLPAA